MSFFANKYVIAGIRMAEIIALTILPALSCAAIAYVTILTMNPRAASAKISTKPIFLCAKSKIPIETVMMICSITLMKHSTTYVAPNHKVAPATEAPSATTIPPIVARIFSTKIIHNHTVKPVESLLFSIIILL